jgi:hypothetical protein
LERTGRPAPSTFMFNDVTGAMYKEWSVVKTNRFNMRQARIFGLDRTTVYNKMVGEQSVKSASKHVGPRPPSPSPRL